MWGVELAVMAGMIALNSVFAAYEMALASVTRAQLQVLRNQRRTGAVSAFHMKDNMEASLAVVQLGITLVGAVAAAVGGVGPAEVVSKWLLDQHFLENKAAATALAITAVVIPL